MYPSVRGSTLKVQGDKLVNKPAVKMMTKVAGETPATSAVFLVEHPNTYQPVKLGY